MADPKQPPGTDELEISLFGPGYGECIAVHTGKGEWLIVDSCIDRKGEPAVINYLNSLGADPKTAVKWIVATHWHDDHVRGLSKIVDLCLNAQFACSIALREKEFLRLTSVMSSGALMGASSGVDEFSRLFGILQSRSPRHRHVWAIESRPLWTLPHFEVHSLSPSDQNVSRALAHIGRLFPNTAAPKNRIPVLTPNHASVALWLRLGNHRVLLGADLEETAAAGRGWTAVLACNTRPQGKALVFKVPHHGSVTAEMPAIWTELLVPNPLAVLTPFIKGDVQLPTDEDVRRIRSRTTAAFITAPAKPPPTLKRPSMVSKTISQTVKRIQPVLVSPGQIRLRADVANAETDSWRVELFNGAVSLN